MMTRGHAAGLVLFGGLAAAGPFLDAFSASLLALVFLFCFLGQAWNLMLGFIGLLSLGHALFVGLGGYTMAILLTRFDVSPWLGLPAGAAVAALAGLGLAWLGCRFSLRGVHFALLTIAFAEFARIMFANWSFVGGSAGLFLPALSPDEAPLKVLRGGAHFFYGLCLAVAALATVLTAWLRRARIGYLWRAIRDDEAAARAMGVRAFRHQLGASTLSAGLTGLGGGIYALMKGALFPGSMFGMDLSIEIIVAPIVGGIGTALGPLIGATAILPVAELSRRLGTASGIFGLSTLTYGLSLILVVSWLPAGIWPALVGLAGRVSSPAPAIAPAERDR